MTPNLDSRQRDELLQHLHRLTARGGVTVGELCRRLPVALKRDLAGSGSGRKTPFQVGEATRLLHALWEERAVVAEPPASAGHGVRFWHADHVAHAGRVESGPVESPAAEAVTERPARRRFGSGEAEAETHWKQNLCGLLVAEWKDAGSEETRRVLERILRNLGAEPSEETDAVVPFKGRRHEGPASLLPGDPVRVVRGGWILRRVPGEVLLSKAQVEPAAKR